MNERVSNSATGINFNVAISNCESEAKVPIPAYKYRSILHPVCLWPQPCSSCTKVKTIMSTIAAEF